MTKEQALQAVAKYIANIEQVQSELNEYGRKLFYEDVERLRNEFNLTHYSTSRFHFQRVVIFNDDLFYLEQYTNDEEEEKWLVADIVIVPNPTAPTSHTSFLNGGRLQSVPSDRIVKIIYDTWRRYEEIDLIKYEYVIDRMDIELGYTPVRDIYFVESVLKEFVDKTYIGLDDKEKVLIRRIQKTQKEYVQYRLNMLLHDAIIESNPKLYADL